MDDMGNERLTRMRSNTLFIVLGWISAVMSLFLYPFIFGVLGIILGILSTKDGSRAGIALIVGSIILMGIGLIFSGVIMNYARHFIGL